MLATVIARYSSEPRDYSSGWKIAELVGYQDPEHPLAEALRRVREQGLIP
jgi:hypothetical protein